MDYGICIKMCAYGFHRIISVRTGHFPLIHLQCGVIFDADKTWVGILSGKWKLEIVRCRNLGTLGIGGAISDYFLKDGKETFSGMCLSGKK